jgi:hypothetical protein
VPSLDDPVVDDPLVPFKKDEADTFPAADRDLPVGALEIRAGDDPRLMRRQPLVDPARDGLQPRQTVGIVKRAAGPHLLNIRWRVKIVTLLKSPVQHAPQFKRYRRFATARDTHQNEDQGRDQASGRGFHRRLAVLIRGPLKVSAIASPHR